MRRINNPYAEMRLEDGVFFATYHKDLVIDLKVAKSVLEDRERLCEYKKVPTLWDCTQVKYWTKEARSFQNSDRNYACMKAGAVIYTSSHVTNVLINFFMIFNKPKVPAKFFTDMGDAIAWLEQFKEGAYEQSDDRGHSMH